METTAITFASLPAETAPGTQARIEARPPGEFAKILQAQPAQAEKPDGEIPDGQEGEPPATAGQEIPFLVFSPLPALSPEGQRLSGEGGLGTASSGSPDFGTHRPAEVSAVMVPDSGVISGPAAAVLQEGIGENPSSPAEESFRPAISPNENALKGASVLENLSPGKEAADSFPEEKLRIHLADSKSRQTPDGGEALLKNLKNSTQGDSTMIASEIPARTKDPFLTELKLSEFSTPENSKTGDPLENPSSPVESSTGLRSSAGARSENAPALSQPSKAGVPEQISQKVVWSLGRHEERFRLTLDPPHLGSIYLEIQRDKEQVRATMWAENPNTKQILESNQFSIQKIIETEGFSLESFNVFVEQDLSAFQESRERMPNPSEAATSGSKDEVKGELSVEPSAPARFAQRGGGGLRSINLIV